MKKPLLAIVLIISAALVLSTIPTTSDAFFGLCKPRNTCGSGYYGGWGGGYGWGGSGYYGGWGGGYGGWGGYAPVSVGMGWGRHGYGGAVGVGGVGFGWGGRY